MGVSISYMGTKKELAVPVCDAIFHAAPGAVLDAFAGMCSVGEAVGEQRPIWTNDVQTFAFTVGKALFTSQEGPFDAKRAADQFYDSFLKIRSDLDDHMCRSIQSEQEALDSEGFFDFSRRLDVLAFCLQSDLSQFKRKRFSLFTEIYSGSFHGVRQCIDADAIVGSLTSAKESRRISSDQYNWLIIALGRALLRCSNTTGHFAQYLTPKENNFRVFKRQRRREIWHEWLASIDEVAPVGSSAWRRGNKSFNSDAISLLDNLMSAKERPGVIYADPPYTSDHYSRYYHLLETLVAYDFPTVTGKGLYRSNRFHSPFSVKSTSLSAIRSLIEKTAAIGADIVLSYPTNGLAYQAGGNLSEILRKYYRKVEIVHKLKRTHSTLGASKGEARSSVVEQIYLGRN